MEEVDGAVSETPLVVAIPTHDFLIYTGFVDFWRQLTSALSDATRPQSLKVVVLLPWQMHPIAYLAAVIKNVLRVILRRKKTFPLNPAWFWMVRGLRGRVTFCYCGSSERSISRAIKRHSANVLIPTTRVLSDSFSTNWVGYLFDLQHKAIPDFFSHEQIAARDLSFDKMVSTARAVVVNGRAVKGDIEKYFPHRRSKIFVLPFAPYPLDAWLDPIDGHVCEKYGVGERYFLICNQFTIHKGHLTAFEAFAEFVKSSEGTGINLVCTGRNEDFRRPQYREEIVRWISDRGLASRVRLLGEIEKSDQIALMQNCIAVIQPTLFEGGPGGGQVFDAVSIGVPCIVSDIPINRELPPEGITFFAVGDPSSLKSAMINILRNPPERPSREVLISRREERARRLQRCVTEIVAAL